MKNRIEEIRRERGILQEELAKALKVSRQTISSLERGRYNPSIFLAHNIAAYFGMAIEEIFIFEEVDNNTNRSGKVNQVKKLSELTGLKYYHFFKAISHDGGEYGLAILSKYPIESSNKINLSSPSSEQRILAHSVINVNGEKINFFVTHLSYDEESSNKGKEYRAKQFNEIANEFAKHENFVLAGDFNTRYLDEYSVIKNSKLVNTKEAPQITYPDGRSPLDNLVYSTSVWTFDKINVVTNSYSDHYMIHSEATYTRKK